MRELIIDNFAGGGGASTGIEAAIGRPVDIAINHDAVAIRGRHKDEEEGVTICVHSCCTRPAGKSLLCVEHKAIQRKVDRGEYMPSKYLCSVCNEPINERIAKRSGKCRTCIKRAANRRWQGKGGKV